MADEKKVLVKVVFTKEERDRLAKAAGPGPTRTMLESGIGLTIWVEKVPQNLPAEIAVANLPKAK